MLTKIFKPRAPKMPGPEAQVYFRFADDHKGPPKSLPTLHDAIAAIEQEKARLRALVVGAGGLMDASSITVELEAVKQERAPVYAEYCAAASRSDLPTAERSRSRYSELGRKVSALQAQLNKANEANAAKLALSELLARLGA